MASESKYRKQNRNLEKFQNYQNWYHTFSRSLPPINASQEYELNRKNSSWQSGKFVHQKFVQVDVKIEDISIEYELPSMESEKRPLMQRLL